MEPIINATTINNCGFQDIIIKSSSSGKFVSYRLLSEDGSNEIRGPQTSNIFAQVDTGSYRVEATDACGQKFIQDITVPPSTPTVYKIRRANDLNSGPTFGFNLIESCNADGSKVVKHQIQFKLNNEYFNSNIAADRFPINLTYEYKDNTGTTLSTQNFTFNSWNDYNSNRYLSLNLPNNTTSVKASMADKCGFTHEQTDDISTEQNISRSKRNGNCGGNYYLLNLQGVSLPLTIKFNNAPDGVKPSDFDFSDVTTADDAAMTLTFTEYSSQGELLFGDTTHSLPPGDYNITYTDPCGYSLTESFAIENKLTLIAKNRPSCEYGKISVELTLVAEGSNKKAGDITHAEMLNGPDKTLTYPVDLSSYIYNGKINLDIFPPLPGEDPYIITTKNSQDPTASGTSCGVNVEKPFTFPEYNATIIELSNTLLEPGCNAFKYRFAIGDKHKEATSAYLEKFDSSRNEWVKITYSTISNVKENTPYTMFISGADASAPKFRLTFNYPVYKEGGFTYCQIHKEEFEYSGGIIINDYYVTQCSSGTNGTYDLLIDAIGGEPMQYRIVSKDGDTSLGTEYQDSPVFIGIESGKYILEVKDNCGNTKKEAFKVDKMKRPNIIANLCEGEFGTLKTSGLSRFETEWYKNGQLVSGDDITDNVLVFNPYTEANDLGAYTARILYTGPSNCGPIETETLTLTPDTDVNPNAGQLLNSDPVTTIIDKDSNGRTNLFNYIQNYDNFGTWSEVPDAQGNISGLLKANEFDYEYANTGTYTFNYIVNGTCSGTDVLTLIIEYSAPCERPFNELDPENFTNIGISNLDNHNVAEWPKSVPNGFIVLESNTKGFTITRLSNPEGVITEPKEGMLVFDTDENNGNGCYKLYNGTAWRCMTKCGQ